MSLRYEASEVPQGPDINSFKLLRLVDSTQAAMLRPVLDSAKFESGKVLLGWHGSLVNVSGFYVQRKSGDSTSARPFTTIATLSKSASGYVDTTRQDSVKVTYQVLAFNQYGISDASNRIVVSVKPSDVNSPEQKKQYNYALEQNYPNPFNPATQITYQLATACPVVLQLFDILGREVAVLVNAEQKAGIYKVALNLENYSCGIYFYTLQAGTFRSTKKMLFLK
jgi:hypothetical protein